ncbi:MAG: hypothetical protein AB1601_04595 [Planctomycetota bacterium]
MGRLTMGAVLLLWGLSFAVPARAQHGHERMTTAPASTQPAAAPVVRCPVTGRPVDRACVTRFRNRWVYCADPAALQKFRDDPYEFADGVRTQWEADKPLRVQVRCPVTGQVPQSTIYVGVGEDAIYFATEAARDKWLADPAAGRDKLGACYTFQTGCATCGMTINPGVTRAVDGRTVYFCCEGCAAEFDRDPRPHLRRIDEQVRANEAAWKQRRSPPTPSAIEPPASHPTTQPQRS